MDTVTSPPPSPDQLCSGCLPTQVVLHGTVEHFGRGGWVWMPDEDAQDHFATAHPAAFDYTFGLDLDL